MRHLPITMRSRIILMGLTLVLVGCGGPTTPGGNPPPPVQIIDLTCPANVRIEDVVGASLPVMYSPPVATGGVPPLVTTCSPLSGANFPLGTTNVTCNATDGVRTGTCSFSITLVPFVPVLDATRFLALGDSITAGENGFDGVDVSCSSSKGMGSRPFFIDLCHSYPSVLQDLLRQRYTGQTPIVVNEGIRGETAAQGRVRLPGLLAETSPDVLLLLEGVNDLPERPGDVIPSLRGSIEIAKAAGLKRVFLSTLTPMKPGNRAGAMDLIGPMNVQIRALAAEQGVVLVDNEAAFLATGNYGPLLAFDGQHPTPEGYQLIAQTFFDAIRASLEQARSTSTRVHRPEDRTANRPTVSTGRRRQ